MPDSAPPAVEARELVCRFGKRTVLADAALTLAAGDRVSVRGPSGAGKTTLLRVLAGLQRPQRGEIVLGGKVANRRGRVVLPPWERSVQMVFQDFGLWPTRKVRAQVVDPLRAAGMERAAAEARADAVLDRLGIAALADRRPAHLSGGEARRVALARALAPSPALLLLDEPFASLDDASRERGFALLESVLAESGAAVLLVTHDADEAARLGGRSLSLSEEGRLT